MNQELYWEVRVCKTKCALFPRGTCSLMQEKHMNQTTAQNGNSDGYSANGHAVWVGLNKCEWG